VQIQFECPSCKQSHMVDIPIERIVHMACGQTGDCVKVEITGTLAIHTEVVGETSVRRKRGVSFRNTQL